MDPYLIVLRLLHIPFGVFWVGSSLAFVWFVGPAVGAVGPDGGKVVRQLILRTRWITAVTLAAVSTNLSGLLMYWHDSSGLKLSWITGGMGPMLTLGGIAGLLAGYFGVNVGKTGQELAKLGERIESAAGPPSPEDAAELGQLQARMQSLGSTASIVMVIAILAMASARYVRF
jgi:hypothetical protein